MRSLHLKDIPIFISSERSNRCAHFSFSYFALHDGSLIFFTTIRVKLLFAIYQCVRTQIRTYNNLCNESEYQNHFRLKFISCYLTNMLSQNYLSGYCSLIRLGLETVVKK